MRVRPSTTFPPLTDGQGAASAAPIINVPAGPAPHLGASDEGGREPNEDSLPPADPYPFGWGRAFSSSVERLVVWVARLQGRGAALEMRHLLAEVEADPTCSRRRSLPAPAAGVAVRGLAQAGLGEWRAEVQVEALGRCVVADAGAPPSGALTAGQVAAEAVARAALGALERLGAPVAEVAREVVLAAEAVRAIARPPIPGAHLAALESWRMMGAVDVGSLHLGRCRPAFGRSSFLIAHFRHPQASGWFSALDAWSKAAYRAAAAVGLSDALEWSIAASLLPPPAGGRVRASLRGRIEP